nr:uncharacterized protein CTRU02_08536 [Colletotrichum truncatum]KAF6789837.1 hypothetical protein CTRU02_08536 [Colletotrichum truncatum]
MHLTLKLATLLLLYGTASAWIDCRIPSSAELNGGCSVAQQDGCSYWCGKRCSGSNYPVCIP